ncbi:Hypothetical protein PBC10988_3960 [Planctomycetales bacterium 10988]|nr:Hypothetical protein PBC10988_3960 [Planctomycetales bacterium 10988]
MLPQEEYIEQAYTFQTLADRLSLNLPVQELMTDLKQELLSSSKLLIALDFLIGELKFHGRMAPAMTRLSHYFAPFQTFIIECSEMDLPPIEFSLALSVLAKEAKYRGENATPQGVFFYQFEAIARNRLPYRKGLTAMAGDPIFDEDWRAWLDHLKKEVGFIDFAELIYLRSEHYQTNLERYGHDPDPVPVLFGEKEGRIAFANRKRDPIFLFAALERHIQYPTVPRRKKVADDADQVPLLMRRVEQLESRLRFLEEENRGGIDFQKLYQPPPSVSLDDEPKD